MKKKPTIWESLTLLHMAGPDDDAHIPAGAMILSVLGVLAIIGLLVVTASPAP